MKMKASLLATLAALPLAVALPATAASVTVDSATGWLGYMNVFNLPSAGHAFQFSSGWGTADLNASFSGPVLTLSPNTIGDPNPYWYTPTGGPGSTGNKEMNASFYREETGPLSGQTVIFSASVIANTFVIPYTTTAFIKDFAPDYSSFNQSTIVLGGPGDFSISLATDPGAGRHVQYGFETIGPNVWVTDAAAKGNIQIVGIPEASGAFLTGLGLTGLLLTRRRR